MNPFNMLPGSIRAAPGLEQWLWRRLPKIWVWGTVPPLLVVAVRHALAHEAPPHGQADASLLLWDYTLMGVVLLHWTLVLTVAIGCVVVRVMKGPAYVADAYALPNPTDPPGGAGSSTN
jgi:hypothetical protein